MGKKENNYYQKNGMGDLAFKVLKVANPVGL